MASNNALLPVTPVACPPACRTAEVQYDWLVVVAGFAGSTRAERLAAEYGERVLVVDRRPHIAGNACDHLDEAGLLIHRHGPHIFHTNPRAVFDYSPSFTDWRPCQRRVLGRVDGRLVPIPINLNTVNKLYGPSLTSAEVEAWLAAWAEPVDPIRTSEGVVASKGRRGLYEKFFRGCTRKQWGLGPSEPDTWFARRLATYRYLNVDQVVGQVLETFRRIGDALPQSRSNAAALACRA